MSRETWATHLEFLRRLPPIQGVAISETAGRLGGSGRDEILEIQTSGAHHRLLIQDKRGVLNSAMKERILSGPHRSGTAPGILFARYVTPRLASDLGEHHVNFVDEAGNCHIELPPGVLIHIVGRAAPARVPRTSISVNGYRVLLALLIAPRLLNASVRDLALEAGVGKSTAADALQVLAAIGLLHKTRKGRVLDTRHLLDRWVAGYADQLRPSLLLARYHPAEKDLAVLEAKAEKALARLGVRWAFTGGVAAQRLTGHFRGSATVLHLERRVPELEAELRLAPSPQGSVTVLVGPGPVVFEAALLSGTAPPVLVYAELLATGGEREREAAEIIRARYLEGLS
jgi:hypothetical protein